MDEIKAVTNDDQRKLLSEMGFLEEVLNLFRVIVGFSRMYQ